MENFPDKISPMTLAAAIALGSGGGGQPSGEYLHYAGSITFSQLPALDVQKEGFVYDVTDGFTSTTDFTDGGGKVYSAGTNVAIVNRGTVETPVMKYDCMSGDFSNFVVKEPGKSLSTNDYTDADKSLVQNSPITTASTGSDITISTTESSLNALTIYGKSEIVDGAIVSAGEGYAVVDLGTLNWEYNSSTLCFVANMPNDSISPVATGTDGFCAKYTKSSNDDYPDNKQFTINNLWISSSKKILIKDTDYTDPADFKIAMSGVLLCYELADPTQGNCIAIKTDNGSGIDGTMAVFETGTPLYGVSDTVRDVMTWDGSAGTVTKNCNGLKITDIDWRKNTATVQGVEYVYWSHYFPDIKRVAQAGETPTWILSDKYEPVRSTGLVGNPSKISVQASGNVLISTENPTDDTITPSGKFIYELATPTTEQLTTAENASIAGLRTFEPQTHAQNNAGATMTIEAYAGTANGQAVNELKQDVQSEISELKITQSDTLTLTTAGWSNNAQTVSYAHDTAKRNVIDVDPTSVEEWANCGVLATAETASGITFTCKTVPENALTFRVTSMGVN